MKMSHGVESVGQESIHCAVIASMLSSAIVISLLSKYNDCMMTCAMNIMSETIEMKM